MLAYLANLYSWYFNVTYHFLILLDLLANMQLESNTSKEYFKEYI